MQQLLSKSGRFVLLEHRVPASYQKISGRGDHCDLLIQPRANADLLAWAVDENIFQPGLIPEKRTVIQLPDHRQVFLEYEGPLTQDRGTVARIAWGRFSNLHAVDRHTLQLDGTTVSGNHLEGKLVLTVNDRSEWHVQYHPAA